MRTLFPIYPEGASGLGLLLLRASAVLLLVSIMHDVRVLEARVAIPLDILIAAIGLGFGTRVAAMACAVLAPILLLQEEGAPWILIATHSIDAAALALLGPGAFSVDARMFGRRRITLKP